MHSMISFAQELLRTLPLNDVRLYILSRDGNMIAGTETADVMEQGAPKGICEEIAAGGQEVWRIVATETDEQHRAALVMVKATLETAVHTFLAPQANMRRAEEVVVERLFADSEEVHKHELALAELLRKHGLDTSLPRAVILIELEEKTNRYFNINLDLGYDASAERAKQHVIQTVKENRYLNKQDIVAPYGFNQIVVVKAFMEIRDTDKYYTALETIAMDLLQSLEASKIFAPRLTYGKVCSALTELRHSYQEAELFLRLGFQALGRSGVYRAEDILSEVMVCRLPESIIEKRLGPMLRRLRADGGDNCHELLRIVETYISTGCNVSDTAQRLYIHRNTVTGKVEKFKAMTGLNPGGSFDDTVLTKLLAVYLRLEGSRS